MVNSADPATHARADGARLDVTAFASCDLEQKDTRGCSEEPLDSSIIKIATTETDGSDSG